jgi:hypothetical protein
LAQIEKVTYSKTDKQQSISALFPAEITPFVLLICANPFYRIAPATSSNSLRNSIFLREQFLK